MWDDIVSGPEGAGTYVGVALMCSEAQDTPWPRRMPQGQSQAQGQCGQACLGAGDKSSSSFPKERCPCYFPLRQALGKWQTSPR